MGVPFAFIVMGEKDVMSLIVSNNIRVLGPSFITFKSAQKRFREKTSCHSLSRRLVTDTKQSLIHSSSIKSVY